MSSACPQLVSTLLVLAVSAKPPRKHYKRDGKQFVADLCWCTACLCYELSILFLLWLCSFLNLKVHIKNFLLYLLQLRTAICSSFYKTWNKLSMNWHCVEITPFCQWKIGIIFMPYQRNTKNISSHIFELKQIISRRANNSGHCIIICKQRRYVSATTSDCWQWLLVFAKVLINWGVTTIAIDLFSWLADRAEVLIYYHYQSK